MMQRPVFEFYQDPHGIPFYGVTMFPDVGRMRLSADGRGGWSGTLRLRQPVVWAWMTIAVGLLVAVGYNISRDMLTMKAVAIAVAMITLAALLLFAAFLAVFWRCRIHIGAGVVRVDERLRLHRRTSEVPLSEYLGIAYLRHGMASSSGDVLALVHPDGAATIPLAVGKGDGRILPQRFDWAARLGKPLLEGPLAPRDAARAAGTPPPPLTRRDTDAGIEIVASAKPAKAEPEAMRFPLWRSVAAIMLLVSGALAALDSVKAALAVPLAFAILIFFFF